MGNIVETYKIRNMTMKMCDDYCRISEESKPHSICLPRFPRRKVECLGNVVEAYQIGNKTIEICDDYFCTQEETKVILVFVQTLAMVFLHNQHKTQLDKKRTSPASNSLSIYGKQARSTTSIT